MNCETYHEMISAELDTELSVDEEPELWTHLAECENCRQWRRDQLTIRHDFQRWPEEALPVLAAAGVTDETARTRAYRVPRILAWAAGLVIVVQGAYLGGSITTGGSSSPTAVVPEGDTVETIELTVSDRVSQRVEQFISLPGTGIDHDENGG